MGLLLCGMSNILSHTTWQVKFLRNEEQHCLLPSLVDDFTCVHSENALLTRIPSTLFSSTPVLFSCMPFGIQSYTVTEHPLRAHWKAHQLKTNKKAPQRSPSCHQEGDCSTHWCTERFDKGGGTCVCHTLLFSLTPAWSTSYLQWDTVYSKEIIWNCHIKLTCAC